MVSVGTLDCNQVFNFQVIFINNILSSFRFNLFRVAIYSCALRVVKVYRNLLITLHQRLRNMSQPGG